MNRLRMIVTASALLALIGACQRDDGTGSVEDSDSSSTDSDIDTDGDTDSDTDTDADTDTEPAQGSWTILMYMDADNNLEPFMINDLAELSSVDPPSWLTILILFDRSPDYDTSNGNWSGTRLFRVVGGGQVERLADPTFLRVSDTGDSDELNMGDWRTLQKFLQLAAARYPAENYGLFLSGHGNGWQKKGPAQTAASVPKYICTDESSGSASIEIQNELHNLLLQNDIDVLGFDACLMSMVEIAWVMQDCVDFFVASQGNEPAYGWDFVRWFNIWQGGEPTPRALALSQVNAYQAYHEAQGSAPWQVTMAAVDLARMPALGNAIDDFMSLHDPADFIDPVLTFDEVYNSYYDLWNIADRAGHDGLKAAIEQAVIGQWASEGAFVPGGLSINYADFFGAWYLATPFCQETDWC